jgi:hypothetical protein
MKTCIFRLILAGTLLAPMLTHADLLIYKGTAKESYTGESHQIKVNSKVILIIDRDTANIARLQYATVNGNKTYYTSHTTNLHFVQIEAPSGKNSTAVTRLPSECEQKEDPGSEGVFLSGANGSLSPDGKATISFPKVLTAGGRGVFYSEQTTLPTLGESSMTVAFNSAETVASNNSGETLDSALARFEALVQSQGYRHITTIPRVLEQHSFASAPGQQ